MLASPHFGKVQRILCGLTPCVFVFISLLMCLHSKLLISVHNCCTSSVASLIICAAQPSLETSIQKVQSQKVTNFS